MDPVEAQLVAYNARDIDAFMACYADDVVVEDGKGKVLLSGHAAVREDYAALFKRRPDARAEVISRIRVEDYVIDEERVIRPGAPDIYGLAIYRVADGKIVHVRFIP